ncbi:hypothetical protein [Oceanospirillum sanctuarii]|uniref:hypothetical protein n=1 Tax=Oceanospirillum sanctuarii TaxID=1434821 RepID=UPI000A3CA0EF|nr:hypothetical protein [Oceanospirillum sanctuarii]
MKASKPITWHKSNLSEKPVHFPMSERNLRTNAFAQSSVSPEDSSSASTSSLAPYYIVCSAFGLMFYGIFTLFQGDVALDGFQTSALSDECHYLSHLGLSGQYQHQRDGSVRCQSQVRYLGVNNQHTLRYMAVGSEGVIEEMRVSLRLGGHGQANAVDELIRFGQSLSLPVIGHTMPAEVGQYLREGHVGHWDFSRASLYIERHHYPVQRVVASESGESGYEDIELVFRKNRVH